MKALTLWQPWASLVAVGAKKYETRSWATGYRGTIAIHAAARRVDTKGMNGATVCAVIRAVRHITEPLATTTMYLPLELLPRGCVIATAELVGCHKMVRHGGRGMSANGAGWLETDRGIYEPDEKELMFGDWTQGRYAWEFANVTLLQEPIPARGAQQLWNWANGPH